MGTATPRRICERLHMRTVVHGTSVPSASFPSVTVYFTVSSDGNTVYLEDIFMVH